MGGKRLEALHSKKVERYEVIDGVIYDMIPSLSEAHQRVVTALGSLFFSALKSRCRTYVAPFDVWCLCPSVSLKERLKLPLQKSMDQI